MKYKLPVILWWSFFVGVPSLKVNGQSEDYALFRPAIIELNSTYASKKEDAMKKYEVAKLKMEAQSKEKSKVKILGGAVPTTEEFMKGRIELHSVKGSEVGTGSKNDSTIIAPAPKAKTADNPPIEFISEPMFPDQPLGLQLYPRGKEPIVIYTTEGYEDDGLIATEEIADQWGVDISQVEDPVEKKKRTEIAEYELAVFDVNRINLIKAMYIESSDIHGYNKMITTLHENNFKLADTYQRVQRNSPDKQHAVMKGVILLIIDTILGRE